jgi:hypothetical protein
MILRIKEKLYIAVLILAMNLYPQRNLLSEPKTSVF